LAIGILAYGSLKNHPGKEIEPKIVKRLDNVQTPFKVEFARSSTTRYGAPTLIPVKEGGQANFAQILVLDDSIDEKTASNMLWRREADRTDSGQEYKKPSVPDADDIVIEKLTDFHNIPTVLYTAIQSNIPTLSPRKLAELAIQSAEYKAVLKARDGISYLMDVKTSGVQTPLMDAYEKEILTILNAATLEEALLKARLAYFKKKGLAPEDTELLTRAPTIADAGKNVLFAATIGKTYIKLSPPIDLLNEYEGETFPNGSYTTKFLDLDVKVENSRLYVSFQGKTTRFDALNYFNNLIALFNIIQIPFDFISPSEIVIEGKSSGFNVKFVASAKAENRGAGIRPVEIPMMDFARIGVAIWGLWGLIKKSKFFKDDECFQLLGFADYYLFHENYFLSFVHAWMFLESCINMLWQEMVSGAFNVEKEGTDGTPLENERDWTANIKIDSLFFSGKIDKKMRDDLHSIRNKRNKVFHRDKVVEKRTVTSEDATKATLTALELFYKMLDFPIDKGIIAFLDVRSTMWQNINR